MVFGGGRSLAVGFGSVVEDGAKKLNFGGFVGLNGLGLVVLGVPETDDGLEVLAGVRLREAVE